MQLSYIVKKVYSSMLTSVLCMCVCVRMCVCVCVCVLFNYLAATEITTWLARTGGRHKSGTLLNCKEGTVLYLQLHVCCCVCVLLCVCVCVCVLCVCMLFTLGAVLMCGLLFLAFPCGYITPFSGTVPVNAVITVCNFRH